MSSTDLADALLDAHVNWVLARLEGAAFEAEVASQLDAFLADASRIKLKDVIRSKDIHATVRKYAVELNLGGAMPELVGDIVRTLFAHKIHDKTRLADLMPDKLYRELIDKLLEFTALRETAIRETVHSPIFIGLITELIYQGISDYAAQSSKRAESLPGARSAMRLGKAVMARAGGDIGANVTESIKTQVRRNTQASMRASERHLHAAFESDEFRQTLMDLWAENKNQRIADLREHLNSLDVEELFVILYEYWQHFRKTDFFSAMVNGGIDQVLENFGNLDLATLLAEIGISRDMMLDDALRFAPPVIRHLKKKNMLEPAVRRTLGGFYQSDELRAVLKKHKA